MGLNGKKNYESDKVVSFPTYGSLIVSIGVLNKGKFSFDRSNARHEREQQGSCHAITGPLLLLTEKL